jgi:hypothetical protein
MPLPHWQWICSEKIMPITSDETRNRFIEPSDIAGNDDPKQPRASNSLVTGLLRKSV